MYLHQTFQLLSKKTSSKYQKSIPKCHTITLKNMGLYNRYPSLDRPITSHIHQSPLDVWHRYLQSNMGGLCVEALLQNLCSMVQLFQSTHALLLNTMYVPRLEIAKIKK